MKTADLFPIPERPRKKRQFLMHVYDAGDATDGESKCACCFECDKCGHKEDWVNMRTVTEAKRGIPCPVCNVTKHQRKAREAQNEQIIR